MEEKIKNFKDYGIVVVVLSFIIIPLISYLFIVKILPELGVNGPIFIIFLIFVYVFIWIRLFNKLK